MKSLILSLLFIFLLAINVFSQWEIVSPKPIVDSLTGIYMFDENNGIASGTAFAGNFGVILKTTDCFNTFQRITTPYRITKPKFFDNMTGYAIDISHDFFVKTTDGGITWFLLPIPEVIVEHQFLNIDTGFVRTQANGIYRTLNGGATWYQLQVPFDNFKCMYFLNSDTGWIGSTQKLYRTTNGGAAWTFNLIDNQITKIAFRDRLHGVVVTYYGGVTKTTNGGNTWTWSGGYISSRECIKLIYNISIIWAACDDYIPFVVYSRDEGVTWTRKGIYNENHSYYSYPTSKYDFQMLNDSVFFAVGRTGIILKSTDSGFTWNDLASVSSSGDKLVFTNDGYIFSAPNFRSSDGGNSWFIRPVQINDYYGDYHFIDTSHGFIAKHPGLYMTTDGGTSFNLIFNTVEQGGIRGIYFVDDTLGYFLELWVDGQQWDYYYLRRTTNGGLTWGYSSQWPGVNKPSNLKFINKHLYFANFEGIGYRGTNDGVTWEYNYFAGSIDFSFLDENTGYALKEDGTVIKTYDKGDSYITLGNIGNLSGKKIVFKDSLHGWIGTYSGIYYSSDGGYTWQIEFPSLNIMDMKIHNNKLFALTSGEVIMRRDLGPVPVELISFTGTTEHGKVHLKWSTATELNNKGFFVEKKNGSWGFNSLTFIPGKGNTTEKQDYSYSESVDPGKYTYRLKQVDYNGGINYSEETEVNYNAPTGFVLEQNYPNPFNPATVIKYNIPIKAQVTLRVYDILGKEISTLVNEEKEQGAYSVQFNAFALSSGIYFYQLKANEYTTFKKMTYVK